MRAQKTRSAPSPSNFAAKVEAVEKNLKDPRSRSRRSRQFKKLRDDREALLEKQLDEPFPFDPLTGQPTIVIGPTAVARNISLFAFGLGKLLTPTQHLMLYTALSEEIENEPSLGFWEMYAWRWDKENSRIHATVEMKSDDYGRDRLCQAKERWNELMKETGEAAGGIESVMDYFNYVQKEYGWEQNISDYRKLLDDMRMLIYKEYPQCFEAPPSYDALDVSMSWSSALADKVPSEILTHSHRGTTHSWQRCIKDLHPVTGATLTGPQAFDDFNKSFAEKFPGYRGPQHPYFPEVDSWITLRDWVSDMSTLVMDKIVFPAVRQEYLPENPNEQRGGGWGTYDNAETYQQE